jgi:hypothetical protein
MRARGHAINCGLGIDRASNLRNLPRRSVPPSTAWPSAPPDRGSSVPGGHTLPLRCWSALSGRTLFHPPPGAPRLARTASTLLLTYFPIGQIVQRIKLGPRLLFGLRASSSSFGITEEGLASLKLRGDSFLLLRSPQAVELWHDRLPGRRGPNRGTRRSAPEPALVNSEVFSHDHRDRGLLSGDQRSSRVATLHWESAPQSRLSPLRRPRFRDVSRDRAPGRLRLSRPELRLWPAPPR